MDNAIYTALSRQIGLQRDLDAVANNIANLSTTGFRREEVIFAEYLKRTGPHHDSISMVRPTARRIVEDQAVLQPTGAELDFALEGPGYFQIGRGGAIHLTRAGSFSLSPDGRIVTPAGDPLLDLGGAEITVPPGTTNLALATDGTLSADGRPLAQLGAVLPAETGTLRRVGDTLFAVDGDTLPAETATFHQGMLEGSNVSAVTELARLVEVQRRYESTKGFIDREDERIRAVIDTLGR